VPISSPANEMTWSLSDRAEVHGRPLSSAAQPPVLFLLSWVHGIEDITPGQHFWFGAVSFLSFEFICIEDMDNSYMKFLYTINSGY
jgi:hypothetical protein